jgi:hypothetical protein
VDIIIPTGNHGYLLPCTVERSEKNRPTICVDTYALKEGALGGRLVSACEQPKSKEELLC